MAFEPMTTSAGAGDNTAHSDTRPMLHGTRRLVLALFIMLATVGCDHAAKYIARETLMFSPPVPLLGDTVIFQYAENTGAFLSLGSDLSEPVRFVLLGVLVAVLLAAIIVYMVRTRSLVVAELVALALIAGGGVGNLIDRMTAGYVVDFVSVGIGSVRTGIFNIADMAITAGMLLFLVVRMRTPHHHPVQEPPPPTA